MQMNKKMEKNMGKNNKIIMIVLIVAVIIFSIFGIVVYFLNDKKPDNKMPKEERMILFEKFNEIFNNTIYYENSNISNVHKIDTGKDIVYNNNITFKKTGSY